MLRAINHVSVRLISNAEGIEPTESKSAIYSSDKTPAERASIVLTTFSPRFFSHAIPTISSLRDAGVTNEIFLVINGDQGSRYESQLRKTFLQAVCEFDDVNPICLGSGRGMAEMWNTGIRLANTPHVIVLNEDLSVSKEYAKDCINLLDLELKTHPLVVLNESFGHFAVTKQAIIETNWFDERFLGFGEEDGDFIWRFERRTGSKIRNVYHPGLNNVASKTGYGLIANSGESKYSQFNYVFLRTKYRFIEGPPQGSFSKSAEEQISSPVQYPHERFRDSLARLTLSEQPSGSLKEHISENLSQTP